ncbi:MAG: TetR family transcriptional regulator, partial [Planctomycetaceae bacterium]|nr:TetR family transcriptional regulator [Planctomycetaceae bacterium]
MSSGETTKARLLEAAGEEFAAKGYEKASIRKICDRVNANCAAVNYHFGSKEQLYVE